MTSAPRSASWSVPHGPAPYCSTATIRRSASGCVKWNPPGRSDGSRQARLDPVHDPALPGVVDRVDEREPRDRAPPLQHDDVVDALAGAMPLAEHEAEPDARRVAREPLHLRRPRRELQASLLLVGGRQ